MNDERRSDEAKSDESRRGMWAGSEMQGMTREPNWAND